MTLPQEDRGTRTLERHTLMQGMRVWRARWLRRLYGGWLLSIIPAVVWGGLNGWMLFLTVGLVTLAAVVSIQARIKSTLGAAYTARVYRVAAGLLSVMVIALLVLWIGSQR